MEKAPKKSWPGSIIIVADILATISIGRQLRSSMNSDRSSDVSSDYGSYRAACCRWPWTILNYCGSLFERRWAEVAQRRVPLPLPLMEVG